MQNSFSFRFNELVWRTLPETLGRGNRWAVELRDPDLKTMSIAIVELDKGRIMWQGIPEHADWWTSLTAFSGDQFFLHSYRFPEIPEPTDLFAYDSQSGELQWVLAGHVMKSQPDQQTVEIVTKLGDQIVTKYIHTADGSFLTGSELKPASEEQIILTEMHRYKEGNQYFPKLADFIADVSGGHRASVIDYLEKKPFMIFSYYIYNQDKTVQYLLIVTDTREIILHERLSEEREGVGHSTVLLKDQTLVYLKNRNEFSSLTLS